MDSTFSSPEIGSVLLTAENTLSSTSWIQDLSCRRSIGEGRGRRGNPIVVYPVRRSLRKQSIHLSNGPGKHTAPRPHYNSSVKSSFNSQTVPPYIFLHARRRAIFIFVQPVNFDATIYALLRFMINIA